MDQPTRSSSKNASTPSSSTEFTFGPTPNLEINENINPNQLVKTVEKPSQDLSIAMIIGQPRTAAATKWKSDTDDARAEPNPTRTRSRRFLFSRDREKKDNNGTDDEPAVRDPEKKLAAPLNHKPAKPVKDDDREDDHELIPVVRKRSHLFRREKKEVIGTDGKLAALDTDKKKPASPRRRKSGKRMEREVADTEKKEAVGTDGKSTALDTDPPLPFPKEKRSFFKTIRARVDRIKEPAAIEEKVIKKDLNAKEEQLDNGHTYIRTHNACTQTGWCCDECLREQIFTDMKNKLAHMAQDLGKAYFERLTSAVRFLSACNGKIPEILLMTMMTHMMAFVGDDLASGSVRINKPTIAEEKSDHQTAPKNIIHEVQFGSEIAEILGEGIGRITRFLSNMVKSSYMKTSQDSYEILSEMYTIDGKFQLNALDTDIAEFSKQSDEMKVKIGKWAYGLLKAREDHKVEEALKVQEFPLVAVKEIQKVQEARNEAQWLTIGESLDKRSPAATNIEEKNVDE